MRSIVPDVAHSVVVVTGGASGIGRAVVRAFSDLGAQTIVADLHSEPPVDVTDGDSMQLFAERVEREHGRCDFLITCAGAVAAGPVDRLDEAVWDHLFEVNVKGVWRTVTALLPLMREGSSIVTVASGSGLRPTKDVSAYAAAKAATIGYTRALAVDLASRGIRANCVAPGIVDTAMHRAAQAQRGSEAERDATNHSHYLIKRDGTAEELAYAIIALATNAYATGSTLAIDGGRSLH